MTNDVLTSKIPEKLGIRIVPKVLAAEPNYVQIAMGWYAQYEKTGSHDALMQSRHFAGVAHEMGQASLLDDPTQDELLR